MATIEWISKAAQQYRKDLSEKRGEETRRRRFAELEQARVDRIASEGPAAGQKLWSSLQQVLRNDIAEFNQEFEETVMWTEARGDGSFNVKFGPHDGPQKIATLTYDCDAMVLSWFIYGGEKGIPLSVGIESNPDPFQANTNPITFMNGSGCCEVEKISQKIITILLP
jgi:hypothetical protein